MTASEMGGVQTLRRAISGRASPAEGRAAVFELLAASDGPRRPREPPRPASEIEEGYSTAVDSALHGLDFRFAERERLRARADEQASRIEEIRRVSPDEARKRTLELSGALFSTTIEALVRRVDRLSLDAPAEAFSLADWVVGLAGDANATAPATSQAADLVALTLRAAGESAYRAGDLIEAERALVRARAAFSEGSMSPALDGELLRLEAEIRSDQSRFSEARRLAQRAVRHFRRAGERTSEARATISLALKWYYEGELERALEETERGLALLDPEKDGRLRLAAEFNRIFWWNDAGRHAEARAALPTLARLAARDGGESDRLRLAWLEARIVAGEGDLESAVLLYGRVLARSLELDTVYDSATVAFELATHLLELGRPAEVLPLAETVARVFAAQGVAPEAAAALLLAADALRQGAAAHEALRLLRERRRRGPVGAR